MTLARPATDTFAGIRWPDAPGFIVAQFAAIAATLLFRWRVPSLAHKAESVVIRHPASEEAYER